MECELDIIDCLNALGYSGKCVNAEELTNALNGGFSSITLRGLIAWLTYELHVLRKTDEQVSAELDDINEFAMELSSLLKELGCPYKQFVAGPLIGRFETRSSLLQLLDYLTSELMATKMQLKLKPAQQTYIIPKFETKTARALEILTVDLEMGKPSENISPRALFDNINFKLEERLRKTNVAVVSEPLLPMQKPLTNAQWEKLEVIQKDLDEEYNLRRQVLLTRLEVTIQSFQWSDKMKARENEIVERYQRKMEALELLKYGGDGTNIVALLAARGDLAIIEKTSSANVRKNTASKIQKHVIGSVPDRGGRANEHAPPPPEMPSWQQQRSSGPIGGGGGQRGGGVGQRGGGIGQRGGGVGQRGGGGGQRGGIGGRSGGTNRSNFHDDRGHSSGGSNTASWQHSQQQQQFQQRSQLDQSREQNWAGGSGRVQGTGWNQQQGDYDRSDRFGSGGGNYQRGSLNYRGGRRY